MVILLRHIEKKRSAEQGFILFHMLLTCGKNQRFIKPQLSCQNLPIAGSFSNVNLIAML